MFRLLCLFLSFLCFLPSFSHAVTADEYDQAVRERNALYYQLIESGVQPCVDLSDILVPSSPFSYPSPISSTVPFNPSIPLSELSLMPYLSDYSYDTFDLILSTGPVKFSLVDSSSPDSDHGYHTYSFGSDCSLSIDLNPNNPDYILRASLRFSLAEVQKDMDLLSNSISYLFASLFCGIDSTFAGAILEHTGLAYLYFFPIDYTFIVNHGPSSFVASCNPDSGHLYFSVYPNLNR